jgi:DNA-binding beta-propeller fold protein YncE
VTHPSARRLFATAGLGLAAVATAFATVSATASAAPAPASPVRHIHVGGGPVSVAVDSGNRTAWVGNGHLIRISEATQRITARIAGTAGAHFVAVDTRRHIVWATDCNVLGCTIIEVSEATNRVLHHIPGPPAASGIAVDPRTGVVWVAARDVGAAPNVLGISEATRKVVHAIRLHTDLHHQLGPITADPRTGTVWASVIPADPSTSREWVSQISEREHRVVHVYPGGNPGATSVITAVDSRRGTAWLVFGALEEPGSTIEVVSIGTHKVLRTILAAPVSPDGLAIDSRTHTVVATDGKYPNKASQNNIVVMTESSGKVTRVIPAGLFPDQVALDPATGNVYVPILFTGVVTQFHL